MTAPFPEVGTPLDQELANAILTKVWEVNAKNQVLRALLHKIDVAHSEAKCHLQACWYSELEVAIALEEK